MNGGLFRGLATGHGARLQCAGTALGIALPMLVTIHRRFFGFGGGVMMCRDGAMIAGAARTAGHDHRANHRSLKKEKPQKAAPRAQDAAHSRRHRMEEGYEHGNMIRQNGEPGTQGLLERARQPFRRVASSETGAD
jgi:hypothetical protein